MNRERGRIDTSSLLRDMLARSDARLMEKITVCVSKYFYYEKKKKKKTKLDRAIVVLRVRYSVSKLAAFQRREVQRNGNISPLRNL